MLPIVYYRFVIVPSLEYNIHNYKNTSQCRYVYIHPQFSYYTLTIKKSVLNEKSGKVRKSQETAGVAVPWVNGNAGVHKRELFRWNGMTRRRFAMKFQNNSNIGNVPRVKIYGGVD